MSNASLTPKMQATDCWAKCDMLYTVSYERLDRFRGGKDTNGKRLYITSMATNGDMEAIEKAILNGLGLRKYLR